MLVDIMSNLNIANTPVQRTDSFCYAAAVSWWTTHETGRAEFKGLCGTLRRFLWSQFDISQEQ